LKGKSSPNQPEFFSWIVDEYLDVHLFVQEKKKILFLGNFNL
jgi:hypothetical protein